MTAAPLVPGTTVFQSLRNRRFRLFLAGQWISQTGTWLQNIGQVILVLRIAGSGVAVGAIGAAQTVPVLVLGLWAGAVIDRTDNARLLIVVQSAQMLLASLLAFLTMTHHAGLPAIALIAALSGTCAAFDNPARRSILRDLVSEGELANATNLHSGALTSARVIGPLLASLIVSRFDVGVCFVVNAVSFAAMLAVLLALVVRTERRAPTAVRGPGQVRAGLSQVWAVRELRATFALFIGIGTLSFNWTVLLPLLVHRDLGGTDRAYTELLTTYSIGSVAGTLWAAARSASGVLHIARGAILFGVTSLVVALSPTHVFALVAAIPNGAMSMIFLGAVITSAQRGSPEMLGRVTALFYVVLVGSSAIGAPLMGWLADLTGPRTAIAAGGLAAMTIGLAGWCVLRDRPRRRGW